MDDAVREAMASPHPPRVLGVYGGDGSVSRMAHLALEFDRPLLALPGGTFNHFARAAGINSVDLAIDALQAGEGVAASVAELTTASRTITVLNAASIGIYPDFVAQRARRKARLGKWFGGVAAAWRELRGAEAIDIELERPAGARLVGVRERRAQHPRARRHDAAPDALGRRARRAGAARPRIAPAGGRVAVVRQDDPHGAADAAAAAAGFGCRELHDGGDPHPRASAAGERHLLRARRRARAPSRRRRGRPLHPLVPHPALRAAGLRAPSRARRVRAARSRSQRS